MATKFFFSADALGLAPGAASPNVGKLQRYLSRFGWLRMPEQVPVVAAHDALPLAEPDRFNDATEAALADFQRFYRLPVTGVLDSETLALLQRPRCGVPDKPVGGPTNGTGIAPPEFVAGPNKWSDLHLGYNLIQGTSDLSNANVLQAIRFAYRTWCLIAKIEVRRVSTNPEIAVRFGADEHGDGFPFDGVGTVLAHAGYPPPFHGDLAGDVHFDDDETWTRDLPPTGTDLDSVALHEAGHSLGLDHSADAAAVMYAYYAAGRRTLTDDDIKGMRSLYGKRGRNRWTNLDAAIEGMGPFAGKAYFFRGDRYVRYDYADDLPDPGYSKTITGNWPNMPAGFTSGIDAAINGQKQFSGKAYFFKGNQYVRYDWAADKADPGYPKPIAGNWPGMPATFASGVSAAVTGQKQFAGKGYFFKGSQYVRYDWAADKVDAGYPKSIAGMWPGLPAGFTSDLQAAVNGQGSFSGKLYFFKGANYVRYDWAADKTDSGYPRPIEFNWL